MSSPPHPAARLAALGPDQVIGLVHDRLENLPGRPGDIAVLLTRLGVRGRRGDTKICPLARVLSANLPAGYVVDVDAHLVTVTDHQARPPCLLPLLPHLTTFIRRFDRGEFPALTEPARAATRPPTDHR